MKRILGIILAVLGCIALFAFLICVAMGDGLTLGDSIVFVLMAIVFSLLIIGWVYLTLWLLS